MAVIVGVIHIGLCCVNSVQRSSFGNGPRIRLNVGGSCVQLWVLTCDLASVVVRWGSLEIECEVNIKLFQHERLRELVIYQSARRRWLLCPCVMVFRGVILVFE